MISQDALELTSSEIKDDKEILKGIVRFGNINVSAVMCPRMDVTALDIHRGFNSIMPEVPTQFGLSTQYTCLLRLI